jgi:Lon protease-like protein
VLAGPSEHDVTSIPSPIPLFPLPDVVLFPHMPLPLHIFEPRYRKMTADALASHKTIGMTLLKPGWERDYYGRPPVYPVGCAGVIEDCRPFADGRFNIRLKGVSRFRILGERDGELYRLATVEPLGDEVGDARALEAGRRKVLAAIGRAADGPSFLVTQPDLPPELFVNAVCQALSLSPVEKQSLLDCDTLGRRCARLLEILDFRLLEQTYGPGRGDKLH